MTLSVNEMNEKVEKQLPMITKLMEEMGKIIVGQKNMLEKLLIGVLADGHILVEGVPGLAKTTAIKSLAHSISAKFQRIQFTPDLLPADLIGTQIYSPKEGSFSVKKGPIFSNFILADEINRAPAKVQSALLEAMQERQVTIGEQTYLLQEPFLVLATQNPIEQEGTYPLPEAQVDRFMLKVCITYPNKSEEIQIMKRIAGSPVSELHPVFTSQDLLHCRNMVKQIFVDEKIYDYVADLVFATRNPSAFGLNEISSLIEYGASPRASIYLIQAAKAHAFLRGRGFVTPQDIKTIGLDVLRHRVLVSYEAEAQNMSSDDILLRVFDKVDVP